MKEFWLESPWRRGDYPHDDPRGDTATVILRPGVVPDPEEVKTLVDSLRRETILGKLQAISEQLRSLQEQLADHGKSTVLPIQHISDPAVSLLRPFMVVLTDYGDGFLCEFPDCNVNASGDTQLEAINNFKDIVVAVFKRWSRDPAERLGPGPARQLEILENFLRLRGDGSEAR